MLRVRVLLILFVVGLVMSGLTAFPLDTELRILTRALGIDAARDPGVYQGLRHWVAFVAQGLRETYARYPFVGYGTDWLAFAHLAIAVFFVGPLIDPVRNKWVITAGLIACVGVIPLALIAGAVRQIPFYWRLIDSSFGVFGFVPLWLVHREIERLEEGAEPA